MRTFSPEKLKERRKAFKLTQGKLAEMTGLSLIYINFLERGRRKPGADVIARLAWCLRVSESYFFVDTKDKPVKRVRGPKKTDKAS